MAIDVAELSDIIKREDQQIILLTYPINRKQTEMMQAYSTICHNKGQKVMVICSSDQIMMDWKSKVHDIEICLLPIHRGISPDIILIDELVSINDELWKPFMDGVLKPMLIQGTKIVALYPFTQTGISEPLESLCKLMVQS